MKYFKNFLLILLSSIILKPAMSYAALNTDYFCEIIVSEQNFNSPLIDNFPKINNVMNYKISLIFFKQ